MAGDLLAEFEEPEALVEAIHLLREAGLRELESFTPYPIRDVQEALDLPRSRIPLYCLAAGLAAGAYAYLIQWWMNGFDYPLNVGGRPLDSAPAFIPSTFEGTVLGASLAAFFGVLAFAGLPRLWHPVFEVEGFERASIDRFFLRVGCDQERFDVHRVLPLLREARALRVVELPEARE